MHKIIQANGPVIETIGFLRFLDMRQVFHEALRFIDYICRRGHQSETPCHQGSDLTVDLPALVVVRLGSRKAWPHKPRAL
jgi:hypothetical protein